MSTTDLQYLILSAVALAGHLCGSHTFDTPAGSVLLFPFDRIGTGLLGLFQGCSCRH